MHVLLSPLPIRQQPGMIFLPEEYKRSRRFFPHDISVMCLVTGPQERVTSSTASSGVGCRYCSVGYPWHLLGLVIRPFAPGHSPVQWGVLQKTLHPSDGEQSPSTRLLENGPLDPMAIVVHLSLTAGQRSEKVKR